MEYILNKMALDTNVNVSQELMGAVEAEVTRILKDDKFVDAFKFPVDGNFYRYAMLINSYQVAGNKLSDDYRTVMQGEQQRKDLFFELILQMRASAIANDHYVPSQRDYDRMDFSQFSVANGLLDKVA